MKDRVAVTLPIRPGHGILFVDCQGLGDVVQSLPFLKAVCGWAADRWPVRALFAAPEHFELIQEESLHLFPFFVQYLRHDVRRLFDLWLQLAGRSDLVVSPPEISASKLVLLKLATGARHAVGEASGPCSRLLSYAVETSWSNPYLEAQNKIAAAIGIDAPLEKPSIRVTPEESAWAEIELARARFADARPLVGVQCSSSVPSKCWPAENFGAVLLQLHEQFADMAVLSFGDATERTRADDTHRIAATVPWFEGCGRWTIRETLAMLSRCDVFISGDTGLMHMAAAVGTPTVSIFGPTSAARRAPDYNGGIGLCPGTPCHPCFRGRWTQCGCIRQITPEQVRDAGERCLRSAASMGKRRGAERVLTLWKT